MELAAEMKRNRVKAQVEWTPREFNREADALANGDSSQFSPELQLRVEPRDLKWHVLDRAPEMGSIAVKANDRIRRSGGLLDRAQKQKRHRREERLKFKGPWQKYSRTIVWWTRMRKCAFAEIVWHSRFRLAFLLPSIFFVLSSPLLRLPVSVPRPCIRLWFISSSADHFYRNDRQKFERRSDSASPPSQRW